MKLIGLGVTKSLPLYPKYKKSGGEVVVYLAYDYIFNLKKNY